MNSRSALQGDMCVILHSLECAPKDRKWTARRTKIILGGIVRAILNSAEKFAWILTVRECGGGPPST